MVISLGDGHSAVRGGGLDCQFHSTAAAKLGFVGRNGDGGDSLGDLHSHIAGHIVVVGLGSPVIDGIFSCVGKGGIRLAVRAVLRGGVNHSRALCRYSDGVRLAVISAVVALSGDREVGVADGDLCRCACTAIVVRFGQSRLGIVDARGSGSGFRLILGTIFIGIIPDGDGTICNRIARAGLGRSSYRICSAIGHRYVGHCNSGGVVPGDLECDLGGIVSDRNADLCLTDIDVTGIGNSILAVRDHISGSAVSDNNSGLDGRTSVGLILDHINRITAVLTDLLCPEGIQHNVAGIVFCAQRCNFWPGEAAVRKPAAENTAFAGRSNKIRHGTIGVFIRCIHTSNATVQFIDNFVLVWCPDSIGTAPSRIAAKGVGECIGVFP